MALGSSGRKLSFDILRAIDALEDDDSVLDRSTSDPVPAKNGDEGISPAHDGNHRRKRKNRASKKKKKMAEFSIPEDLIAEAGANSVLRDRNQACFDKDSCGVSLDSRMDGFSVLGDPIMEGGANSVLLDHQNCVSFGESSCAAPLDSDSKKYSVQSVVYEERTVVEEKGSVQNGYVVGELRQRNVNGGGGGEEESGPEGNVEEEKGVEQSSLGKQRIEGNGSVNSKLETAESLDWKQLMADDPNHIFSVENSPLKYFMEEMYGGNSLRSTTTLGNEKERERVYDTIFRLPWRCELLIDVGFLVCFDSFLSLLTIMPTRIFMTFWRLAKTRQFKRLSAAELCDFGCFIVLACGVTLLEQTDISLIYHMIRGQGTIKLYVVYNVLEIFDKLFQSFGGDVLQTLFNSAEGFASCPPENTKFWLWRFISDQALAVAALILHSFILLAQAITLSTCIVAHNNALLALLVSNNFSEIKSNVFKRFNRDNIQSIVYFDSVERFHISAFLLFVLAQNILEAEGPWFESFFLNALLVYICEIAIDIIKHSFLAKFNNIRPIAYSEFLEDLCKQTLNIETGDGKKNLTFVPLAPACVVIRVLTPIYGAHLPYGPLVWRLFWISILSAVTYVMLFSLKVMVGMILRKHAIWYINRCQKRRHHLHYD